MDFKIRYSSSGFVEITTDESEIILFKDNKESIEIAINNLLVIAADLANYIDTNIIDYIE